MPETIVVQARFAADFFTAIAFPAGSILPHGSTSIPSGFLLCDGSAISRTTFATLFAAIGTTWGVGDGSTTFNLPDCRSKTLFGQSSSGTFSALGTSGGVQVHTHTASHNHFTVSGHTHSFPNHTHAITTDGAHVHDQGAAGGGATQWLGGGILTSSAGSHSHGGATPSAGAGTTDAGFISTGSVSPTINNTSNLNPYVTAQYVIKV